MGLVDRARPHGKSHWLFITGCLPPIEETSGTHQPVDKEYGSTEDESEQLEPVLEQLATHVPDLIVFRSHDAPLPQTVHSYGVIMFGDISGKAVPCSGNQQTM